MAIIRVTDDLVKQAREFAEQRIDASEALYRARGEDQRQKMIEDIVTGTVAEYAVAFYLRDHGLNCTDPDTSIHTTKSFSADLLASEPRGGAEFLVHVKAQTAEQAAKYGESWIFQVEDRALSLPSEKGYGVFCIVTGSIVQIKAAVWLIDILEAEAVSKPKVGKYAMFKNAIYLSDLVSKNINIRRF